MLDNLIDACLTRALCCYFSNSEARLGGSFPENSMLKRGARSEISSLGPVIYNWKTALQ